MADFKNRNHKAVTLMDLISESLIKGIISIIILLYFGSGINRINAQTSPSGKVASASDHLVAHPVPDRSVSYSVSDTGVSLPIIWGLDTAWPDSFNIKRGVAFMGADNVDIVRASFQPTLPLIDGDLQEDQEWWINFRLDLVDMTGPDTKVALNCDHPTVDPWYVGNASRWAQLMDMTTSRVQERGRTIVSIAPFNEPDYGWGQGSLTDFYNIAGELRQNPRFDSIRISGGNTLNTDEALNWYNQLKSRLDEGNTHQLAGSFDNYANFFETVRANGHHATNDELHNVMEAMVGVEYGMQTGIWWGTAELARGEFAKASDGRRLGYAEHRPNWTAASVYRSPEGKVQAFGGTSERQARTTTYRFVSQDRDVFYDGYGPQREYTMVMPGDTLDDPGENNYEKGQTNAERVVNITWGDDIQPVINGRYVLVNRNSGLVMEVAFGSQANGANLFQRTYRGFTFQQWDVTPVDSRVGDDFSYFAFTAVHSGKAADLNNFSLNNGGNIQVWNDGKGTNQQWYLEYAGDGWFYIRSRHSAKCMEVADSSIAEGGNIQQWDKDGGTNQQWRFLPVGATVEFDPPSAPNDLVVTANAESIRLDWSASPETDVAGYTIFRSESAAGPYNTIARNVKSTSFIDNTCTTRGPYFYTLRAVDSALNRSAHSNEVSATATGERDMIAHLQFDGNTLDSSINLNHGAPYGEILYVEGQEGSSALALNGTDAFVQLPSYLANQQEISVAVWIFWKGGVPWQRIFDFSNDQDESLFLIPGLRLTIMSGTTEHSLNSDFLPINEWSHVAVTLGVSKARMFLNGVVVDSSSSINISPLDFKPFLNYIGRSQDDIPLFNGYIDDFRVYNYALSIEEVAQISRVVSTDEINADCNCPGSLSLWPVPANDLIHVNYSPGNNHGLTTLTLLDMNGRTILLREIDDPHDTQLNIADLSSGLYMLKLTTREESRVKKFIIQR